MENNNRKGWLYLLPAIVFLGVFMVYPLIDVLIYSFEEGFNFASQTSFGVGLYNYSYVLHDPYFLQAVKNTFILVLFTVPISTGLALLISLGLNSIEKLRQAEVPVQVLDYPDALPGFMDVNYPETKEDPAKNAKQEQLCNICEKELHKILKEFWSK